MPSRLILRSGDEVFTTWSVGIAIEKVAEGERAAAMSPGLLLDVPLVMWDGGARRSAFVRAHAIDGVEPLDERELRAHARDREEWIEHG